VDFLEAEERLMRRVHDFLRADQEVAFRIQRSIRLFFKIVLGSCLVASGVAVGMAVNARIYPHATVLKSLSVVLNLTQIMFLSFVVFILFSILAEVWLHGGNMKETVGGGSVSF